MVAISSRGHPPEATSQPSQPVKIVPSGGDGGIEPNGIVVGLAVFLSESGGNMAASRAS